MSEPTDKSRIDAELMRRVAGDDQRAIGELYDRFGSLVYRMAYQVTQSRTETDDAVQEIFVRLWQTSGRYDPLRASLVTWVMLISRRQLVDRMRRSRARIRPAALGEDAGGQLADTALSRRPELEHGETMRHVMKKIDDLPDLQRTVVLRAYLGGQTLRQIGQELNTPLGTVKSALSRALTRLRETVGSEEMMA